MLQITISKRAALIVAVALVLVVPGVAAATHAFVDVDDSSVHAPGIEWVKDAGVTAGCGDGTTYCPGDDVTRAQMGTFMCRLAGNCGVAPSVNADAVDGWDSSLLVNFISSTYRDWEVDGNGAIGAPTAVITHSFNAPSSGFVMLDAHMGFWYTGPGTRTVSWLQLDDATCGPWEAIATSPALRGTSMWTTLGPDADAWDEVSTSRTVGVTAGDHTLTLCVDPVTWDTDPANTVGLDDGAITTLFSPVGSA